jgi:hypothetical protein
MLVFAYTEARAEQTVIELLRSYDTGNAANRLLLEALVSQTQNGLTWANSYLRTVRKEQPISCHPKDLVPTGSQVIDMLRREVVETPNTGTMPIGMAILMANIKVFPCSLSEKPN